MDYRWDGGSVLTGFKGAAELVYFAEGTTRNGFEEYLILRNPQEERVQAEVAYQFPAPAETISHKVELEPGALASILVNDVVGAGKDVSIRVGAPGGILAEREIYFNYLGIWTGGNSSVGAQSPLTRWYFAEGTTRAGFREWLCVQNPGKDDANINMTFFLENGEQVQKGAILKASSRSTFDVRGIVGDERDVSVLIESSIPIVAERPMYFDYLSSWRGGHVVSGAGQLSNRWYFAEGTTRQGFDEWLCILNPGPPTKARVEYIFNDAPSLVRTYFLPGGSRRTISVNNEVGPGKDVSVLIEAPSGILCERPMYFLYQGRYEGGHVVMGSNSGSKRWMFASAPAGENFSSWLCVMNPGKTEARASLVILGGSEEKHISFEIAPGRRLTFDINAFSAGIGLPWLLISSDEELILERPTYFSYEPKVESAPFGFAAWNDVQLMSPIRYCDYLGAQFHEAYPSGGDGKPDHPQALQPLGECMRDDNPKGKHPGVIYGVYGEAAYFIEESRGRGTYSTTACDVLSKAGENVYAPADGVVIAAENYLLYGKYPDMRVRIAIDGHPGCHIAVLHLGSLCVERGQRVKAGISLLGTVRDLVPYFYSGPNPYTREDGNHVHVQVNYRPDIHL